MSPIPRGPAAVHWWLYYAGVFRRWGHKSLARQNVEQANSELRWWGPIPLPK